jgi:hypothetical protein
VPAPNCNPPTSTSQVAGNTGVNHHTQLVCWDRVSNFLPRWPQTESPVSISHIAETRGMHHHTWLIFWDRVTLIFFVQAGLKLQSSYLFPK